MFAFNSSNSITSYKHIEDIINEHYNIRLQKYYKRKEYQLIKLQKNELINRNKAKFVSDVINNKINRISRFGLMNQFHVPRPKYRLLGCINY
jgi:DNA gyrase/topoisomerase IV subunit A